MFTHWRRQRLTAGMVVLLTSCSFIDVRPPHESGDNLTRCTRSREAPSTDLVMAALGGVALAIGMERSLARTPDDGRDHDCCNFAGAIDEMIMATGFIVTVGYGTSAFYGFSNTARCRRMRAERGLTREPAQALRLAHP